MPSISSAYYCALMNYTTIGSGLDLPLRWRLLEGVIAMSGWLTFAWSTMVLLTLTQAYQESRARSSG